MLLCCAIFLFYFGIDELVSVTLCIRAIASLPPRSPQAPCTNNVQIVQIAVYICPFVHSDNNTILEHIQAMAAGIKEKCCLYQLCRQLNFHPKKLDIHTISCPKKHFDLVVLTAMAAMLTSSSIACTSEASL